MYYYKLEPMNPLPDSFDIYKCDDNMKGGGVVIATAYHKENAKAIVKALTLMDKAKVLMGLDGAIGEE